MTKQRALATLSFLLFILMATGLYAQPCDPVGPGPSFSPGPPPPAPPPFMSPGPHAPGMPGLHHPIWGELASVGLDVKQKHALERITNSVKKSVIRKTADLQIARIELGEALGSDAIDMKLVEEKVRMVASLHADMELSAIRAIEEAKALLTPAQKTRLKELQRAGDLPGCPPARPPLRPGKKDGPAARPEKG